MMGFGPCMDSPQPYLQPFDSREQEREETSCMLAGIRIIMVT
jgi:hypothetical protein